MKTKRSEAAQAEESRWQRIWDRLFTYVCILFIGVALGYAWCWTAMQQGSEAAAKQQEVTNEESK